MLFLFHKQIHEISPGAIQKSNGLKVTCLMNLYFKFEEDAIIFLRIFLVPPTPPVWYTDSRHHTLIMSHRDDKHTDTDTFPTSHKHTYMKNVEKKKKHLCKKAISKFRPHQMTAASQRASRESGRIQINNIPLICECCSVDPYLSKQ